jgi:hypothetical protein
MIFGTAYSTSSLEKVTADKIIHDEIVIAR